MKRSPLTRLAVLGAAGLLGLSIAGSAHGDPALATADDAACGTDAVTVVVDAEMLDGDVDVRCVDVDADTTALDAVTTAGFAVEGTAEFGSSIVCRVDGAPDQTREPCDAMPSADAYWISWVGTDDGWAYAEEAIDTHGVAAGDVVGLAFQEGPDERQPAVTPQDAVDQAEPATDTDAAASDDGGSVSWTEIALGAAVVVALALLLVWVLRRRGRSA